MEGLAPPPSSLRNSPGATNLASPRLGAGLDPAATPASDASLFESTQYEHPTTFVHAQRTSPLPVRDRYHHQVGMTFLNETIEALLWEDEGTTLDFKQAQYPFAGATDEQKAEIIKDILALSNAFRRDDAYILLGAKDLQGGRATIIGVANHLDDAHLQQLANNKTNRTAEFDYHPLEIDGQQVGAIRIPRQQRPTYLPKPYGKLQAKAVYIRHGSTTSVANPDEIARMGADQLLGAAPTPQLALQFGDSN